MGVFELIRKEGLRRGLSPKTIKTYSACVERFLKRCRKEQHQISKKDIEDFMDHLIDSGSPGNTLNVYLNSLKFYYGQILKKRLTVNIKYSKQPQRLPVFLTQDEVKRLIDAIENKKHKLMISLLYSSGLRVSELVNLKVKDLQLDQDYGWVRQGKGRKDRPFIISARLKQDLNCWIKDLGADTHLFIGHNQQRYSTESIRAILKEAAKKAKITKNISPHTLRHSFATHLVENRYTLIEVQTLLGHTRLDTTSIYTHLASPKLLNVRSPLDSLR